MDVKLSGYIERATKLKEGEVEFVISTDAWDAYGERILPEGINFKEYKKNPVVLWAHDGFNLPIAKTTKIWQEGKKTMARAMFNMNDEFPAKVYQYILDGFLNAASIGGQVMDWAQDGVTIAKLNMKEWSVVPIPANSQAVVAAKSFSPDQKTELNGLARMYARKMLVESEDELAKTIKVLKSLTASLEEVALSETSEDRATKPERVRVVLRQAQAVDHQIEKIIRIVKKP